MSWWGLVVVDVPGGILRGVIRVPSGLDPSMFEVRCSPSTNRGELGERRNQMEQTTEVRERLNLSISMQLRVALEAAGRIMGMSASQVALHALMEGMPKVMEEAEALMQLHNVAKGLQGKGGKPGTH